MSSPSTSVSLPGRIAAERTDEQLVASYIQGDNTAFDCLLQRYESKVFTYIAYSVRNEEVAQDLFQECFMRIITRLKAGQYTAQGKFASWVMRIAHNLIIDHHRRTSSASLLSADEPDCDVLSRADIAPTPTCEQEMAHAQTLSDVKALIRLLPESQREVVLLRYYDELPFKEIAAITGVSINTALGRMRYALINLRRLAKKYDISLAS